MFSILRLILTLFLSVLIKVPWVIMMLSSTMMMLLMRTLLLR